MSTISMPSHRLRQTSAFLILLAVAACAQPPVTSSVAIPPIPAGEARVWFYRDEGPYESRGQTAVRMNDAVVGELDPRGAFYRDTAPGHYHVAVDSYIADRNAARDVDLVRGQQVYFKVVSENTAFGGGALSDDVGSSRPTFYLWLIPDAVAQSEVARSPFDGGH
jgi:hypothetical protein